MSPRLVSLDERTPLAIVALYSGEAASREARPALSTPANEAEARRLVGTSATAARLYAALREPKRSVGHRSYAKRDEEQLVEVAVAKPRERTIASPLPEVAQRPALADGSIVLRRYVDPHLYVNGISPFDFAQVASGDCWLVASNNAIAATRPEYIEKAISDNHDGTYTVHLYRDGKPIDVTVDDDFYMSKLLGKSVYVRQRDQREIWGAILEKAFAALSPEGYQSIHGGFPADAMRMLTNLDSDDVRPDNTSDDALFETLSTAMADKRPSVAEILPDTPDEEFLHAGLTPQHAYTLLGTVSEDGERYVILRNTADTPEFRSSRYDADVKMTVERGDNGLPDKDGSFRMRLDDYRHYFWRTIILKTPPLGLARDVSYRHRRSAL